MARKMASAVQAHLIDKGRYLDAVQFTAGTALERCELVVDLPAGADPVGPPARRVTHVAFMAADVEGAPAIGCVPALGVVALADAARLREAVVEAIVLEYRRNGRLSSAALRVAYERPLQLSLEYGRLFCRPPKRDFSALRELARSGER
jgi:hypothetical protein